MDFTLTEDQREFRALLRSFVDREIIPVAREWEHAGRYPTEIVRGMADMGLFGVTVPEEYGGLDLDPVSFALVFEEISRGWMGIAGILGSHSLACKMIAVHGTEEQKRTYLPELGTGARLTGIGLTEPDAGTDLQGIRTTARLDGDHFVVTSQPILNRRVSGRSKPHPHQRCRRDDDELHIRGVGETRPAGHSRRQPSAPATNYRCWFIGMPGSAQNQRRRRTRIRSRRVGTGECHETSS